MLRKIKNIKVLILFSAMLIYSSITQAAGEDSNASQNKLLKSQEQEVAAPHTQYNLTYTINAQQGMVVKQADGKYQLILRDVHDVINYYTKGSRKCGGGMLAMAKFLKQWDSAESKSNQIKELEADITGIQVNNQNVGHKQFYQVAQLSKPSYDANEGEIIFNIKFDANYNNNNLEQFDNVTVYINACKLCDDSKMIKACKCC